MESFINRIRAPIIPKFNQLKIVSICAFILFSSDANAWIFGPFSEDQCKRNYAVTGESELAVKAAIAACNNLFAEKPTTISEIKNWETKKQHANCILADISSVKTDYGAKLLSALCNN